MRYSEDKMDVAILIVIVGIWVIGKVIMGINEIIEDFMKKGK